MNGTSLSHRTAELRVHTWLTRATPLAAILAAGLTACAPTRAQIATRALASGLDDKYHECVPLGWDPVPSAGYYYPGYTSEYREQGVWLRPFWIGVVHAAYADDPRVRTAQQVMDALVDAGMLQREMLPGATYYRLTHLAIPYYFEDNHYGDNPDHLPYLCYSRLIPRQILSTGEAMRGSFRGEFELVCELAGRLGSAALLTIP